MENPLPGSLLTNVLLVEDSPEDAELILESVQRLPYCTLRFRWVQDLETALSLFPGEYQAVVTDLTLPGAGGLDAVKKLLSISEEIPLIVLTGADDIYLAVQAIEYGAQDFIVKGTASGAYLARAITLAIRRNELRLRLTKMQERIILATQGSNEGIWDIQPDGDTGSTYWSPRFFELLGYTDGEIVANRDTWRSLVHPDDLERVVAAVNEHIANDLRYEIEYRMRTKTGEYKWFQSRGTSVRNESGKVIRMAGTIRDISEKKAAEEQHKRLLLLEQQRDFLATLTHDLKNPLLGAERIFELFVEGAFGDLTTEQSSIIQGLRKSNQALLEMIQNYIELYRLDELSFTRRTCEIDVKGLLLESATEYDAIAQSRDIDLKYDLDDAPPPVIADRSAIRRLISNLIGNALKFTPSGGNIDVGLHPSGDDIILTVDDTGPGIPTEELQKLYRRFSQVSSGRGYSDGSGLGLYVCNKIVDALGGNIRCESQVGKGTKFIVALPSVSRLSISS